MTISAQAVKELREMTGAGMMDCKKALQEVDGDLAKAAEYLQIKGLAKAAKKADRVAAEGLVVAAVAEDGLSAALVEINCETDFVARNEDFQAFCDQLAQHAVANGIDTLDALLASKLGSSTVEELRQARVATIGENISIRRVQRVAVEGTGLVGEYVHNGNIGVLVALTTASPVAGNAAIGELARDVAMHAAAMNPLYAVESEISDEDVADQTRIETEKAMESGKPREIAEKMVTGRIQKWKKEICLATQPFVKNPDVTVAQEIQRVSKEAGNTAQLTAFVRFVRGEGIEKKESNLAEEVAAALK